MVRVWVWITIMALALVVVPGVDAASVYQNTIYQVHSKTTDETIWIEAPTNGSRLGNGSTVSLVIYSETNDSVQLMGWGSSRPVEAKSLQRIKFTVTRASNTLGLIVGGRQIWALSYTIISDLTAREDSDWQQVVDQVEKEKLAEREQPVIGLSYMAYTAIAGTLVMGLSIAIGSFLTRKSMLILERNPINVGVMALGVAMFIINATYMTFNSGDTLKDNAIAFAWFSFRTVLIIAMIVGHLIGFKIAKSGMTILKIAKYDVKNKCRRVTTTVPYKDNKGRDCMAPQDNVGLMWKRLKDNVHVILVKRFGSSSIREGWTEIIDDGKPTLYMPANDYRVLEKPEDQVQVDPTDKEVSRRYPRGGTYPRAELDSTTTFQTKRVRLSDGKWVDFNVAVSNMDFTLMSDADVRTETEEQQHNTFFEHLRGAFIDKSEECVKLYLNSLTAEARVFEREIIPLQKRLLELRGLPSTIKAEQIATMTDEQRKEAEENNRKVETAKAQAARDLETIYARLRELENEKNKTQQGVGA